MDEIAAASRCIGDIIGDIGRASSEQSQGIAAVGQAILRIDEVAQQYAALVEQNAPPRPRACAPRPHAWPSWSRRFGAGGQ